VAVAALVMLCNCKGTSQESVAKAVSHAKTLVEMTTRDVAEVRQGLPQGAAALAKVWSDDLLSDPEAARRALGVVRDEVQDLRVAKSTFFALVARDGTVVRNDREQDMMAGRPLFQAFPAAARALEGGYVETLGVMPEAHGVKGVPDGEWMAAHGVRVGDAVRALYVTGWAWSSYAYRLEFALRARVNTEIKNTGGNVPLLYTFIVVGTDVYGAPEFPEVNARAIAGRDPLKHLTPEGTFSDLLEVTGRTFALGVQSAPALGPAVAIGVLRSET
jgi:hypothetical protein